MPGVHVRPTYDLIAHDLSAECVCGPTAEPVPQPDGSTEWLHIHHSLDAREHQPPPPREATVLSRLANYVRQWIAMPLSIKRMENDVATAAEQLTEFRADFADFVSDVDAKLQQLIDAQGQLDPAAQAIYDDLKATLAAADERIGDADGSDNPPTEPPVEPPVDPTR